MGVATAQRCPQYLKVDVVAPAAQYQKNFKQSLGVNMTPQLNTSPDRQALQLIFERRRSSNTNSVSTSYNTAAPASDFGQVDRLQARVPPAPAVTKKSSELQVTPPPPVNPPHTQLSLGESCRGPSAASENAIANTVSQDGRKRSHDHVDLDLVQDHHCRAHDDFNVSDKGTTPPAAAAHKHKRPNLEGVRPDDQLVQDEDNVINNDDDDNMSDRTDNNNKKDGYWQDNIMYDDDNKPSTSDRVEGQRGQQRCASLIADQNGATGVTTGGQSCLQDAFIEPDCDFDGCHDDPSMGMTIDQVPLNLDSNGTIEDHGMSAYMCRDTCEIDDQFSAFIDREHKEEEQKRKAELELAARVAECRAKTELEQMQKALLYTGSDWHCKARFEICPTTFPSTWNTCPRCDKQRPKEQHEGTPLYDPLGHVIAHLVKVHPQSAEFRKLLDEMEKNCGDGTIKVIEIFRVQNPELYKIYDFERRLLQKVRCCRMHLLWFCFLRIVLVLFSPDSLNELSGTLATCVCVCACVVCVCVCVCVCACV